MQIREIASVFLISFGAVCGGHAAETPTDRFAPLERFIGDWAGTATGEGGAGTVTRSYRPVINGRFIHETNTSRYPPSDKNKLGEVHEHWGVFSYDKARKLIVLRQFHVEGFVNTYRQAGETAPTDALVFESESFENFSNDWQARESYQFISADEFIETFELAPPGMPYQLYSRNQLKRVSK